MNRHEIQTIKQETLRFSKDIQVSSVGTNDAMKLTTSFTDEYLNPLFFFITKRKGSRRFSLMTPVEATGILAVENTLNRLQAMLKGYGLLITQEAVIVDENYKRPLHERIRNFAQVLCGIDGIRRLWKVEYDRRVQDGTEGQNPQPASDTTYDSPSR